MPTAIPIPLRTTTSTPASWHTLQRALGAGLVQGIVLGGSRTRPPMLCNHTFAPQAMPADPTGALQAFSAVLGEWTTELHHLVSTEWEMESMPEVAIWALPGALLIHPLPLKSHIASQEAALRTQRPIARPWWAILRPPAASAHKTLARRTRPFVVPHADLLTAYLNKSARVAGCSHLTPLAWDPVDA